MNTRSVRSQRMFAVCLLCVMVAFSHAGCTPLKKKFIRQKKKDKETANEFVPVLEPEVYPVKTTGPADVYAQQYSLLNVWVSDFAENYQAIKNDKRMSGDLESALKAVEEMSALLQSPAADDLEAVKKQIVFIRDEFVKPQSFRNVSRIDSELRDIDRTMIRKLKPALVAESLKGEKSQ